MNEIKAGRRESGASRKNCQTRAIWFTIELLHITVAGDPNHRQWFPSGSSLHTRMALSPTCYQKLIVILAVHTTFHPTSFRPLIPGTNSFVSLFLFESVVWRRRLSIWPHVVHNFSLINSQSEMEIKWLSKLPSAWALEHCFNNCSIIEKFNDFFVQRSPCWMGLNSTKK